ncbi:hypothetical protein PanWU01x14_253740 [Parasponia andersonii]|uniref:Uncharacterized protein n=1 Tax=Parasponia andersonii TaxID=3476 RepID=A0A2P5BBJ7_PARAD|nr:hypothetical protein PanWU01x14_253740 [Parasponia andersonii]
MESLFLKETKEGREPSLKGTRPKGRIRTLVEKIVYFRKPSKRGGEEQSFLGFLSIPESEIEGTSYWPISLLNVLCLIVLEIAHNKFVRYTTKLLLRLQIKEDLAEIDELLQGSLSIYLVFIIVGQSSLPRRVGLYCKSK